MKLKKASIICGIIIIIGIIIGGTWYYYKIKELNREKIDYMDAYEYIHALSNQVLLEEMMQCNDIDRENEELICLKDKYVSVINNMEEFTDIYILSEIIIVNDYYSIDNSKYYKMLDEHYIEDLKLFSRFQADCFYENGSLTDAVDCSTALLVLYSYTDFGKTFIKDYYIIEGLHDAYNSAGDLSNDECITIRGKIADAFAGCDINDNIDMSLIKHDFETDLEEWEKYYSSKKDKYDLSVFCARSALKKFKKVGFSDDELKEIREIVDCWSIEELKKNNFGFKDPNTSDFNRVTDENLRLSTNETYIGDLRTEMYQEDNLFRDEDFVQALSDYCDRYTSEILIPKFDEFYNSVKDKIK